MRKKSIRHRGGFAMTMAIILLGLTAMTMTALAVSFAGQARRTRLLAEEAQLRQLLLAGAIAGQGQLQSTGEGAQTISMPLSDSLRQQGAALKLHILGQTSAGERTIEIQASFPRHPMAQRVHFSKQGLVWRLDSAQLCE